MTAKNGTGDADLASPSSPACSIGLLPTENVMEHVCHPVAAFRQVARSRRPGGAHVFTVLLVRGSEPSRRRSVRQLDLPPEN